MTTKDISNKFRVTPTRVPNAYAIGDPPAGHFFKDDAMNLAAHLILTVGGEAEIETWLQAIKGGELEP